MSLADLEARIDALNTARNAEHQLSVCKVRNGWAAVVWDDGDRHWQDIGGSIEDAVGRVLAKVEGK